MKRLIFISIAMMVVLGTVSTVNRVQAATIADNTAGYILLQVERNGEAWYVHPTLKQRIYLGRPADALHIMNDVGVGITNADLAKIPTSDSSATGDTELRKRVSGKILLQVEKNGEAWYVYPGNTKRYFLGRPTDAFSIMRTLGLGISDANLAQIPIKLDPQIMGAGNIASCTNTNDTATAALLSDFSGNVFTLGDNAYPSGTSSEYTNCYHPTWGAKKSVTFPSAGDVDYLTADAGGYYGYFGRGFGPATHGYYRYTIGTWNVYSLNSNCSNIGGCTAGSAEYEWLKNELTAHPTKCTLVYMHHPRFTSTTAGDQTGLGDLWSLMDTHNVDVVMSGHNAHYERFAPMNPDGTVDYHTGIRSFVVGTGGAKTLDVPTIAHTGSEVRVTDAYGALKLTLHPRSYSWDFISTPDEVVEDTGAYGCH